VILQRSYTFVAKRSRLLKAVENSWTKEKNIRGRLKKKQKKKKKIEE